MAKNFDVLSPALFEAEASKTARTFGRDHSISVVFQGENAVTVDNTIVFPALDQTKQLTHEQVMVSRGYVDHEAAHIQHTDMPLFQREKEKANKNKNPLLATAINALEDIRIERIVTEVYPGAAKNLSATNDEIISHFMKEHGEDESVWADTERLAPLATTWIGRRNLGYHSPVLDAAIDKLDPKLREKCERWAKMAGMARGIVGRGSGEDAKYDGKPGTSDVIDLAKTMVKEILNPEEEEEESKGKGKGDGSGDGGGEGEGDEEAEGGVPSHSGSEEGMKGDGTAKHSRTQGGTGSGKGITAAIGENDDPITPFDVDLNIMDTLHTHVGGNPRNAYRPVTRAEDKVHTRHDVNKYPGYNYGLRLARKDGAEEYRNILVRAQGKINVMRRKLERAIMSVQRRDWDGGREIGRLDSKRLVGAVSGMTNVFKDRREAPSVDTALSVLIDLSGSMSGRRVALAQKTAICLAEALEKTGVAYEILGFSNSSGYCNKDVRRFVSKLQDDGAKYSRWEPLDLYVFKDFDERLREAQSAMGAIASCSGGNNADGEAVMMAYNRLRVRPEKKKILLVLSDGWPAAHTSFDSGHLNSHLRNVVEFITSTGTHLVGIGIMDEAVKQFYPRYVVLKNLDDLSKSVLDQIGKMILGERFVVDNSELIQAHKLY